MKSDLIRILLKLKFGSFISIFRSNMSGPINIHRNPGPTRSFGFDL